MLQCGLFRSNFALPIVSASYPKEEPYLPKPENPGAGDGNRTHVASLEGWSSTIELHPPDFLLPYRRFEGPMAVGPDPGSIPWSRPENPVSGPLGGGGGGRIRTYVDVRQQIYSLPPLTTRPPLPRS